LELPLLSSRSLNAFILGCVVLTGGCDRESGQKAQPAASGPEASGNTEPATGLFDRSHKGSALPDFLLKDPAGKELQLASLKGKPLLINLWATWCAPCVAELPALNRLATARGDSLKVLTISQDMAKPEAIAPFLQERGVTRLEPWIDPAGDLAMQYDVQTLPTTIYYDATGHEVWRLTGAHDWTSTDTAALLAEAR
jgi:thiol-disulfide isomerase/thioredoxin